MLRANGAEIIVDSMRIMGVTHAFGIVAYSTAEITDLLDKGGVKFYGVRHEQWAGHMADAYGRMLGSPALLLVQGGGGLANVVTPTALAKGACSPMIIVTDTTPTRQITRGAYQETDNVAIIKSVTKYSERVPRADRIAEFLRLAYRIAMTPPRGPVHIDVPRDFLYELTNYERVLLDQFMPARSGFASPKQVVEVSELLLSSKRPVILAGGACVSKEASPLVEELSRLLQAPLMTTYSHNDAIRSDYDLSMGSIGREGSEAAMRVYSKADLVLALGTRLEDFTFNPYYGFDFSKPDAKIIQVTLNLQDIGRSRKIDLGIVAEVTAFLEQLIFEHKKKGSVELGHSRQQYVDEAIQAKNAWKKHIAEIKGSTKLPIMQEVYSALRKVLPEDAVITLDVGSSPSFAYGLLEYHKPKSLLSPSPLGGLGFAIPAAIGAKLAEPTRPVYALLGDGAFTMEIPALITAIEYDIPINLLVFDNGSWGAEKNFQDAAYNSRYVGTILKNPDLSKLSATLGANTETVEAREGLEGVMRKVFAHQGVNVLVAKVDPDTFPPRRDATPPERGIFKQSAQHSNF